MFPSNRKASSEFPTTPPPERHRSALSSLLVSETSTTRTEGVPTTTAETTTQLFSFSYWRKRNVSQPTTPQTRSFDGSPPRPTTFHSSRLPSFDKALPPTPCSEDQGSENVINEISYWQSSPILQGSSRSTNVDREPRSAQTQVQTSLGLGLPNTSHSPRLETAIALTLTPSPPPSLPTTDKASSQLRKAKSTNRLRTPDNQVDGEQIAHRRRRGFSFGAPLLIATTESQSKGKGKETELSPVSSKSSPKPLARKSSFWRKKAPRPTELTSPTTENLQDNNVLTLTPLPPVNVSPFAAEFALEPSPSVVQNSKPLVVPPLPRSQSDSTGLRRLAPGSTKSSPKPSFDLSVPPPTSDALPVPQPRTPPLFHRLSFGVFASSEPSTRPNLQSQSKTQLVSISPIVSKPDIEIPKPIGDNESPEHYLSRLKSQVSKAEVASTLASSSDAFYATTLKAYLNQFEFSGIPLDVALRKLLMEVGLPRETQQIDRVVEAFAFRYRDCNPNLFTSEDHPYILAFSLIMLHTDAFNPSNKRKMTKADYVKNTRLPGVPSEVLECFFDNIVFAPFIFIEDPEDANGQPGLNPDLAGAISTPLPSANVTANFKTGNKVDPYYLIMNNLLDPLRVDINSYIPLENPFTFEGAHGPWNEIELHNAFLKAKVFDMDVPTVSRQPAMFSLSPNGSTDLPTMSLGRQTWRLKVTKVGLLNRKDDLTEGGKKTLNRKWKTWSVILTGSQLLFCRDPTWASVLLPLSEGSDQQPTALSNTTFRPDEFFSLKDAIAVFDCSYKKYNHTFRFILSDGRHFLLQAANDEDLHQWISRINYASTFKTAGVRMRPAALSGEDVHLTGVAAATSHLHDIQKSANGHQSYSYFPIAPNELMDMLSSRPCKIPSVPKKGSAEDAPDFMQGSPVSPASDSAEEFKATFNQVKADLASNSWSLQNGGNTSSICETPPASPHSSDSSNSRFPPRSQIILRKIRFFDAKIASLRSHLESEERFARNIAILTPFRKSTRTRLLGVIQNLARPVMQVRLELEKLKCHRAVLHSDFVSETRSRNHTKRIALRAATDILRPRRPSTAPAMSHSMLDDKRQTFSPNDSGQQSINTPPSLSTSSSSSFHSARESLCESSGGGENSVNTSPRLDCREPHGTSSSSLLGSALDQERDDGVSRTHSSSTGWRHQYTHSNKDNNSDDGSHGEDDEQAEEWNKTRAAHRVSLIQVPCDIATATRLKAVLEGSNGES